MTVRELTDKAHLRVAAMPDGDRSIDGVYIGDLLSWVMGRAQSGDAWVTIMSNQNIVAVATLADVACVILAEDVQPDEGVAALAQQKGINLLCCSRSAFGIAGLLQEAL